MPKKPEFLLTDEILQAIDRQFKFHGSLAGAVRALGIEKHYSSLSHRFGHLGNDNPYAWRGAAKRYERRTGEYALAAVEYLAPTHTRAQIAEMLGFPSGETLGKWVISQGARPQYGKRKAPDRRPITEYEADQWLKMREGGMKASEAAELLGRDEHRLCKRAYELFLDRCLAIKGRPIRR